MNFIIFMGLMVIVAFGGLYGVLIYMYVRDTRHIKRVLSEQERELTIKLLALLQERDTKMGINEVMKGESVGEALRRVMGVDPINQEIDEVSRQLTNVLIEKL